MLLLRERGHVCRAAPRVAAEIRSIPIAGPRLIGTWLADALLIRHKSSTTQLDLDIDLDVVLDPNLDMNGDVDVDSTVDVAA